MAEDPGSSLWQPVSATITITDNAATPTVVTLVDYSEIEISLKRNTAIQWKVVLKNYNRQYTRTNTGSAFYGWMKTRSTDRLWSITLTSLTDTKTWSYLVPLDFRTRVDSAGNMIAEMTGTDYSWALFKDNQSMPSWKSVAGDTVMMSEIAGDICANFSVSSSLGATDYPWRVFHFIAQKPMDALERCLRPVFGEWYQNAQVWTTRQPAYLPTGPADFTITDYKTIEQLEDWESAANVITKVTVQRITPAAALALDIEGLEVGIHTDALDFAIINPSLDWDAAMGVINLIYLFDDDDNYSGVFPQLPPAGAATKLNYVFQQKGGLTENEAERLYYHIWLKGDRPQSGAEWDDLYEEDYIITRTNTTLEAEINESIPARAPIIEDGIPNQATAITFAEGYLRESAKGFEGVKGQIGLYLTMTQGQTLNIVCYLLGINAYYYTEEVTHKVIEDRANTTIMAYKARSDSFA